MKFSEFVNEERRLMILRLLESARDYKLSEHVLQSALEPLAHTVSRDRLRHDLEWLKEQGLVDTETVGEDMTVALLTSRGEDVARGRSIVPGVKRPGPGG